MQEVARVDDICSGLAAPGMPEEVRAEVADPIPRTPWEAFERWRAFAAQAARQTPRSALHAPAPLQFFVTLPGRQGWCNHLTDDDGLYGKVVPPFRLQDGRSIVPQAYHQLGDYLAIEFVEKRKPWILPTWVLSDVVRERMRHNVRINVTIRQMTAADLRERFGLEQVCDPEGRPATLLAHGAFIEARSPWRGLQAIDRAEDLLEAVMAGERLPLTPGRLDCKGLGTIQHKLSVLQARHGRILVRLP